MPASMSMRSKPLFQRKTPASNLILVIADWLPPISPEKHKNHSASSLLKLREYRTIQPFSCSLLNVSTFILLKENETLAQPKGFNKGFVSFKLVGCPAINKTCTSPKLDICLASSISVAPAPGTNRSSRVRALNVFTPSSTARSISSMMFSVEPRIITVATAVSSRSAIKFNMIEEGFCTGVTYLKRI